MVRRGTIFAFNKIAFISMFAVRLPGHDLPDRRVEVQEVAWCPPACRTVTETTRSTSSRSRSSCPPSAPRAWATCRCCISMFLFILICNLFEVIPTAHMPANARMANPLMLALTAWAVFIGVGVKHHGLRLLQDALFPPGVPKALYLAGDADRAHLDLPHPALLPRRPSLRQHAGGPHPAGHLLGADASRSGSRAC